MLALGLAAVLGLAACGSPVADDGAGDVRRADDRPGQRRSARPRPRPPPPASPERAAARSRRGGHPERRAERDDHVLDVLPVADLRPVHQGHDRPLRGDLSGRHGQLGRPPGHVQGRPEQRVRRRATRRTSSTCRSARAGSASTPARACCSPLDDKVPQTVQDIYFPGLWKEQLIDGVNYQFPWYQGLNVELINNAHLRRRPASTLDQLPEDARRPAGPVPDDHGQDQHPLRHPPDRQRPARPDGLRGRRQGLSATTARPSRSTRPKASRGSRCTSTWSRPAPSTTPS